jgi:hypothetical protein
MFEIDLLGWAAEEAARQRRLAAVIAGHNLALAHAEETLLRLRSDRAPEVRDAADAMVAKTRHG